MALCDQVSHFSILTSYIGRLFKILFTFYILYVYIIMYILCINYLVLKLN